jgi:hypothetical protein
MEFTVVINANMYFKLYNRGQRLALAWKAGLPHCGVSKLRLAAATCQTSSAFVE